MVAACAETDKSEARSAPPCPIKHTRADCVCKNGQLKGKISTSVSVFAHTWRLRVQKRTNKRQGRNPRVRKSTRTMATCAETDTLGSEPPPSCPFSHTHDGNVCRNGHFGVRTGAFVSEKAHALWRRVHKRTSSGGVGQHPQAFVRCGESTKRPRRVPDSTPTPVLFLTTPKLVPRSITGAHEMVPVSCSSPTPVVIWNHILWSESLNALTRGGREVFVRTS